MSPIPTLTIDFAAVTDVGCVRQNNEDSYGFDSDHHLYVVCDGMGGCAAGEVASNLAVRALIDAFASSSADRVDAGEPIAIEARLMGAILEANRAVYQAGASDPALQSMGTTLVCVCLDGDRAVIGNVGDSRAYLIREKRCVQITLDHSLVEEQIRAGNLSSEDAAPSKLHSVITRAIGVEETVEPDLFEAWLQSEDMLLLASDGVTRYLRPENIVLAVADGLDLTAKCRTMVDFAKQCGGVDNITCVLVRATKASPEAPAPVLSIRETKPVVPMKESKKSVEDIRLNESHI
jgi:serine/threonine protein phosphatase PrpC